MSKIWENPCESASDGDWDSKTENGDSTIIQSADAAWPGRGGLGLRTSTAGAAAYVQKNLSVSVPAGNDLYGGFWYCVRSDPDESSATSNPYSLFNTLGTSWAMLLYYRHGGLAYIYARADGGSSQSILFSPILSLSRWYWVVVRTHRASSAVAADGYVSLYVDGTLIGTTATVDNYDIMATPAHFAAGARFTYADGYIADQDEFKVATSYPEPHVPKPRIFV